MIVRLFSVLLGFLFFGWCAPVFGGDKPSLQLAVTFDRATAAGELDLSEFWVSEKLDGVRAFWDGEKLVTRAGNKINAPMWFVDALPNDTALDGELWIARGKFELVSGTVRRLQPDDAAWRLITYQIFDLPKHPGVFDERVVEMRRVVGKTSTKWLQMVDQIKVGDLAALQRRLDEVVAAGGEGLMLHRGCAVYHALRTDDLIKFKPLDDAEAKVVSYVPGKGKHEGRMGALLVELPDGKRFKIGTGFTDAERMSPPPIGAQVTFQYSGLTANGIPRFARFLRQREEF